jgi:hypothetical protein
MPERDAGRHSMHAILRNAPARISRNRPVDVNMTYRPTR